MTQPENKATTETINTVIKTTFFISLLLPSDVRSGDCKVANRPHRFSPLSVFLRANDSNRLLHDQVILYGFDPFDVPCDLTRFINGLLSINEAAQLDDALVSFDTDLE